MSDRADFDSPLSNRYDGNESREVEETYYTLANYLDDNVNVDTPFEKHPIRYRFRGSL